MALAPSRTIARPPTLYVGDLLRRPARIAWAPADVVAVPVMAAVIAIPTLAMGMVLGRLFFGGPFALGSAGHLLSRMADMAVLYGSLFVGTACFTVGKYGVSWQMLRFQAVRGHVYAAMIPLVGLITVAGAIVSWALAPLVGTAANLGKTQINDVFSSFNISWSGFLAALLILAVVAPIVEETYFRGMLYGLLREHWGPGPAVGLSALIFAAAHFFAYGHSIAVAFPQLFILGVVLAIVAERTRSLYPAILLHSLNNGIIIVALFWGTAAAIS